MNYSKITQPLPQTAQALVQSGPETAATSWFTSSDGAQHFVRTWQGTPGCPIVIYLHGIEGHGRWFESTALVLNEQGCTIYAADRRGAGSSPLRRGHLSDYKRLLLDIEEFVEFAKSKQPREKCFVIANCWGAKPAIALAAKNPGLFDGLILTSPAISVKVDVDFVTKIKIALSYLGGSKGLFDIPLTPEHFTDQPAYLQYISADPLRLKQATAAFFIESLKLSRICRQAPSRLTKPLLILQSGRDAIVDVSEVEQWLNKVAAKDKQLQMFPSAAHSLDFDPQVQTYQTALSTWLLEHASNIRSANNQ